MNYSTIPAIKYPNNQLGKKVRNRMYIVQHNSLRFVIAITRT